MKNLIVSTIAFLIISSNHAAETKTPGENPKIPKFEKTISRTDGVGGLTPLTYGKLEGVQMVTIRGFEGSITWSYLDKNKVDIIVPVDCEGKTVKLNVPPGIKMIIFNGLPEGKRKSYTFKFY